MSTDRGDARNHKPVATLQGKGAQDVMQAQVEAYNTRDLDRFLDCYGNDALFVDESGQTIMKGRDQIRQAVAKCFASFPNLNAQIQGEIRFGAWVVQKEKVTGVQNPKGGDTAISLVLSRVENNKITLVRRLASNPTPQTS